MSGFVDQDAVLAWWERERERCGSCGAPPSDTRTIPMTVTRVEEADARTLSGPDSEIVTATAGSESVTFEQHPAGTWRIGDRLTVTIERERKR